MKKVLASVVALLLVFTAVPAALAVSTGSGITADIRTEDFEPLVFMCDGRRVTDDNTEPGRKTLGGEELRERTGNYAFEGEMVAWDVLVLDKNKIEDIKEVVVTVGDTQGEENPIEAECKRLHIPDEPRLPPSCNARIDEERLERFDPEIMDAYRCKLTVETPDSMYGEFWVTVEAQDGSGNTATMDENEFWFFNPVVALSIDGSLEFDDVRPGTDAYSDTLTVGNDADAGSGVLLDMFITGTDFYDSSSSAAACPNTNQLSLSAFRYFATAGAYSTATDAAINSAGSVVRNVDAEGYVNIEYGIGFNNPSPFYNDAEIMQVAPIGPYWAANILAPGAEVALTFKLSLPVPCNGDFDSGQIFFWGEAI